MITPVDTTPTVDNRIEGTAVFLASFQFVPKPPKNIMKTSATEHNVSEVSSATEKSFIHPLAPRNIPNNINANTAGKPILVLILFI